MVNTSTNINKTNNDPSPELTDRKKKTQKKPDICFLNIL